MDKASAQAAFSLKRTSDGAPVSGAFGWYGPATLLFQPDADLAPGTQYTATVTTAAKDLAGNPLPAAKSWQFTTSNPPIIKSVSPADGASNVAPGSLTIAFFNKDMDKASAQAAFSLKRTSDGAPVSGSLRLVRPRHAALQARRRPGARDAVHRDRHDRRQGPRRERARQPCHLELYDGTLRLGPSKLPGCRSGDSHPKRARSDLGRGLYHGKVTPCGGVCPFSSRGTERAG